MNTPTPTTVPALFAAWEECQFKYVLPHEIVVGWTPEGLWSWDVHGQLQRVTIIRTKHGYIQGVSPASTADTDFVTHCATTGQLEIQKRVSGGCLGLYDRIDSMTRTAILYQATGWPLGEVTWPPPLAHRR